MTAETASPCTKVCVVHPARAICIGCGRSLDEIAGWMTLTEAERAAIMTQLPARLAAIGSPSTITA